MRRTLTLSAVAVASAALLTAPVATAAPAPDENPPPPPRAQAEPPVVAAEKRGELLGDRWQASDDRLWTTTGDGTGFHVLVADAKTGYSWRTVATLNHPAAEADTWVGNACVTASGAKAVVVYAPRAFTNNEKLFARGGFTAVVDLNTGEVTKLPVRTTLAYYNPGCGLGEEVALTQAADQDLGKTGLLTVDATTAKLSDRTEVTGQLTSAVPIRDGFAVAGGTGVLKVDREGRKERISSTKGVPFHLKPDAEGGIVYMAAESSEAVNVQRSTGVRGKVSLLARGAVGKVGLAANARGVSITGDAELESLPSAVRKLDVPAGSTLSTTGEMVLTEVLPSRSAMQSDPQTWHIRTKSLRTGKDVGFGVDPADALTPREVEPDRTCAVARNDPGIQVLQPKPKQVEWAVDMAVKGHLDIHRPAGWIGNPGNYYPEQLFPPLPMANANGGTLPAQVLLGVTGQEANMWQASRHTLPGETGNSLIGNYSGLELYDSNNNNDWDIDFADADCGYGVTQVTDGMRMQGRGRDPQNPNEPQLPYNQQLAIATDYAANVSAGMRKLQEKWNEVQAAGMTLNNNDVTKLENWFFAAWAYNSGFHQPGEPNSNGAWGLGWANNPANPHYDPNRHSFGEHPTDFAHPQLWPYPEKVLGFAGNPPSIAEDENTEVPFFRYALWPGGAGSADVPGTAEYNKRNVKPPRLLFCTADNNCVPGGQFTPTDPEVGGDPVADTGPCAHQNAAGQYDLRCWWHTSTAWKPACNTCGVEMIRYDFPEYAAEPANGTSYPPTCPVEPPVSTRALVVDHTAPTRRPNCTQLPQGTGTMSFGYDRPGAWVDLHQLGTGLGGHSWISHTKRTGNADDLKAVTTASWELHSKLRTRARVLTFIPAHGGQKTTAANYQVQTAWGTETVTKNQQTSANQWLSLGVFDFDNIPKVTLNTLTGDGATGNIVAFDALAFVPVVDHQQDTDLVVSFQHVANGKCITSPPTATYPAPVVQNTCLGNFSDDWLIRYVPNTVNPNGWREYLVVQRSTGMCLATLKDTATGNYSAVTRACLADPTAGKDMLWTEGIGYMNQHITGVVCNLHTDVPISACLNPEGLSGNDGVSIVVSRNTAPGANTYQW